MPYMVTWIPSIYPLYVSIYTSTMDPMGYDIYISGWWFGAFFIFPNSWDDDPI